MTNRDALWDEAKSWMDRDPDPNTREALSKLLADDNPPILAELFGGRLSFGTAGLRAVVGPGPKRMNRLVVEETSLGLGRYVAEHVPGAKARGIIVGYDARVDSRDFAEAAAAVFGGLGIKTYLFDEACPTPLAAFALLHQRAAAAIVITASHNPPEYNGYKVYWEDGAQIVPPHDEGIAAAIRGASTDEIVRESITGPLVGRLGPEVFDAYRQAMGQAEFACPLRVAYSPMHGVGGKFVAALLEDSPLHLFPVDEQFAPDGSFPTVAFPNPEEPGAMDLLLATAAANHCDLALANDPDADRLAASVLHRGAYRNLSGNDIGVLLGHQAIVKAQQRGAKPAVATTVVSSPLLAKVAEDLGAACVTTLTGFKWLMYGLRAAEVDQPGVESVFAYEEALGYGHLPLVADKDGLSALIELCVLAAAEAVHERSLIDRLHDLWRRYGIHLSAQRSLRLSPETEGLMHEVREDPPQHIGDWKIERVVDYLDSDSTGLAPTNALEFSLETGARVILRPSGTEPKIKCYYDVAEPVSTPTDHLERAIEEAQERLNDLIEVHQESLGVG